MLRLYTFLLLLAWMLTAQASHLMLNDTLHDSAIYPGTVHTLQVSVPDGYDGTRAACLYVGLDGVLCNAPAVIDSLMATGDMPLTIGIYLQPGVIKAAGGTVVRYNRSNEFDAIDGQFARFLETEVLPAVERLTTPDGRRVRLSHRATDRMIFGLSSGGIAAFVAAWQRPDLFSRVFSGCGTFVTMRGGEQVQLLVRKSEPRPLRVFLQDGYSDAWNALFGSWYEANRMLASALEFAGCDCAFDWAEGGHSVRRSNLIMGRVLKWLWRGYPAPVVTGVTGNDLLQPLLVAGSQWAQAPSNGSATVARQIYYPDSSLLIQRQKGDNRLYQSVMIDHKPHYGQPFYWLHSLNNAPLSVGGMAFDSMGNLWVVTGMGIQICDQNGRVRGIVSLPQGLTQVNSVAITIKDGQVVLSSPTLRWQRQFNVHPATPGKRPASQGQG